MSVLNHLYNKIIVKVASEAEGKKQSLFAQQFSRRSPSEFGILVESLPSSSKKTATSTYSGTHKYH